MCLADADVIGIFLILIYSFNKKIVFLTFGTITYSRWVFAIITSLETKVRDAACRTTHSHSVRRHRWSKSTSIHFEKYGHSWRRSQFALALPQSRTPTNLEKSFDPCWCTVPDRPRPGPPPIWAPSLPAICASSKSFDNSPRTSPCTIPLPARRPAGHLLLSASQMRQRYPFFLALSI
jgi:hypothetical protein